MKVLIVFAHPERKSFNGALLDVAVELFSKNGHEVKVSDLYAMKFNPVSDRNNFTTVEDPDFFRQSEEEVYATKNNGFAPDLEEEMRKLEWCDTIIFQFPLYWYSMPAIMKGWLDRVFAAGRFFDHTNWFDQGHAVGKRAFVSLTTGGAGPSYGPEGLHGEMNQNFLYAINNCFRFLGFDVLPPFVAYAAARITDDERKAFLREFENRLLTIETTSPIKFTPLAEFDRDLRLRKDPKTAV